MIDHDPQTHERRPTQHQGRATGCYHTDMPRRARRARHVGCSGTGGKALVFRTADIQCQIRCTDPAHASAVAFDSIEEHAKAGRWVH